jgi:AcrR family transcriptional regulator
VRTRARLLDAAVDCLVTFGYAGTTMARVQATAEVSRGTLTHHFSSMQELLVAAVQHVAAGQLVELEDLLGQRTDPSDTAELVRLLHRFMSGPMFLAGLELWVAARTDAALREALMPAERAFGQALRTALEAAPGQTAVIDRADLEVLLSLLRGLAISGVLRKDPSVQERVLTHWSATLRPSDRAEGSSRSPREGSQP